MNAQVVRKGRYAASAVIAASIFCATLTPTCTPAKTKTISAGISVNVRLNKYGKKVNLASTPAYRDAVATFSSGKYAEALTKFQTLDRTGFCCDMVHYYIAQCYQYTNQVNPAMLHYEWVSVYSKDRTLVYYASGAYEQLAYYNGHRTYAGQGNNFDRVRLQAAMRSSGRG